MSSNSKTKAMTIAGFKKADMDADSIDDDYNYSSNGDTTDILIKNMII